MYLGMCRIDFLYWFGFSSVCEKVSDLVQNEFGSVEIEKRGLVWIL